MFYGCPRRAFIGQVLAEVRRPEVPLHLRMLLGWGIHNFTSEKIHRVSDSTFSYDALYPESEQVNPVGFSSTRFLQFGWKSFWKDLLEGNYIGQEEYYEITPGQEPEELGEAGLLALKRYWEANRYKSAPLSVERDVGPLTNVNVQRLHGDVEISGRIDQIRGKLVKNPDGTYRIVHTLVDLKLGLRPMPLQGEMNELRRRASINSQMVFYALLFRNDPNLQKEIADSREKLSERLRLSEYTEMEDHVCLYYLYHDEPIPSPGPVEQWAIDEMIDNINQVASMMRDGRFPGKYDAPDSSHWCERCDYKHPCENPRGYVEKWDEKKTKRFRREREIFLREKPNNQMVLV